MNNEALDAEILILEQARKSLQKEFNEKYALSNKKNIRDGLLVMCNSLRKSIKSLEG